MSRIGKLPITIPAGVEIKVSDKNLVTVKGALGSLQQQVHPDMTIEIENGTLSVKRPTEQKRHKAMHGLYRTLIANSGSTPEIKVLIPFIKLMGNKLIAMVGNIDSYLAQQADYIIRTSVEKEVGKSSLAPTTSSTAQLAMGDALVVCLMEYRGFTRDKFAMLHPGGTLGKKLFLRVSDIYPNNEKPAVSVDDDIASAIIEMTSKRLGATCVMQGDNLAGIITDGDLRRMMQSGRSIDKLKASDIMTKNPKTVNPEMLVADALDIMRKNNITQLPVKEKNTYIGMIHIHDILKEGIL
jgi:arabinose-5-phosphate isomerase